MTRAEQLFLALQVIDTATEAMRDAVDGSKRDFRWAFTFRAKRRRFRLSLIGVARVDDVTDDPPTVPAPSSPPA